MNKKLVLATARGVKTDEVQGTTTAGNSASAVTAPIAGTTGAEKNEATETAKQPTAENTNAEVGSESDNPKQSGVATNDDDI